jgi:hypothetical protein
VGWGQYADVIVERYERLSGKKAVLEATGQSYAELRAERAVVASYAAVAEESPA